MAYSIKGQTNGRASSEYAIVRAFLGVVAAFLSAGVILGYIDQELSDTILQVVTDNVMAVATVVSVYTAGRTALKYALINASTYETEQKDEKKEAE
jgi:hypothetical protein